MKYERKLELVPIWMKSALTLEEAAAFSGLGKAKLMDLACDPNCGFIIWNGEKRLYKRRKLVEFLNEACAV